MEILVTGGAGFIGSHLSEALLKLGYHVRIIDNFSSGSLDNIVHLIKGRKVDLIQGDCTKPKDVRKALTDIDVVFHFAANPEVRLELNDPKACFQQNVHSTHVILEEMRKSNIHTIVFTSTSTVYGDAKKIPTPEDYAPLEPISIYGASKLASEALISSYVHTYNKKAVILRLANIVGPRSRHGVIIDFIMKLRNNLELEILGDGTQTKSYLYIDDCIEAILKACEVSNKAVEVFNIGSEDQITVKRIAEIVAEEMGLCGVKFKFTGGVDGGRGWVGDVKNMLLDISKIKSRGWKPRYNSEEAIRLATRFTLKVNTPHG